MKASDLNLDQQLKPNTGPVVYMANIFSPESLMNND
jgi:hypothetical protein